MTLPRLAGLAVGVLAVVGVACSSGEAVAAGDESATTTARVADSESPDESGAEEVDDTEPVEDDEGEAASDSDDGHDGAESVGEDSTADDEGQGGLDGDVDMVIPIEMNEWGYEIADTSIPAGSKVRFEFVNVGVVVHEAMFGTMHQQEEFAGADDHGDHADDDHHGAVDAITLDPGETGSLLVEFDEPGEILIGCHLPGHWEAGMVTTLTIT